MSDRVASVQSFVLTLPRDEPYLGPLRPGETVNAKGYFVHRGNRTVYPTFDRSVLVRVTSSDGAEGWGETYGLVAPRATTEIIDDLLGDFVVGRDPFDAAAIHDDLYALMRVRGYTGGFYLDALAAVDIALWDLAGRLSGRPLADLLGGRRRRSIPAYVSGLPAATLAERLAIASRWCARGFDAVKFAGAVADRGPVAELAALRRELGASVRIGVDLHWRYQPAEAIRVIRDLEPYDPWFAEAPVAPEEVAAQAAVARAVRTPIALGEEWRTAYDAKLRFERGCPAIVQPEMGHTGPTEFLRIAALAEAGRIAVMPHATIGVGIFLAASLHAAAAIGAVASHEFQHSILHRHRGLLDGPLGVCRRRLLAAAGARARRPSERRSTADDRTIAVRRSSMLVLEDVGVLPRGVADLKRAGNPGQLTRAGVRNDRHRQRSLASLHQTVVLKDERARRAADQAGEVLDSNISGRARGGREGRHHLGLGRADHVSRKLLADHGPVELDAVLLQERRLGLHGDVECSASGRHAWSPWSS